MQTVRIICFSLPSGDREGVIFTEDLIAPAKGFIPLGYSVDGDVVTTTFLPDTFPMEYILWRE